MMPVFIFCVFPVSSEHKTQGMKSSGKSRGTPLLLSISQWQQILYLFSEELKERRDKETNRTQNTVTVREGGGGEREAFVKSRLGRQLSWQSVGVAFIRLQVQSPEQQKENIGDVVLATLINKEREHFLF